MVAAEAAGAANNKQLLLTIDPDTQAAFVLYSDPDSIRFAKCVSTTSGQLKEEFVLDLPHPGTSMNGQKPIVGIQHLPDADAVCVAYVNGDLFLVNCFDGAESVAGSVESGILAMSWSPDYEVVVLISGTGSVLVTTRDFDTICEVPGLTLEYGEGEFVSVGWGKKETQFHGTLGKAAAKAKAPEVVQVLSPDDDSLPRISWRGDGSYFVCSFVDQSQGRRVLRVYSREGVLQSTSEPVSYLEHLLAWRPSGNLIASTQRHIQKHDIVFFERNGLRHGEFTLREPVSTKVVDITWNQDSTVLAIVLKRESGEMCVQLWTMGNYHWYLKQEIRCLGKEKVASVLWHPEQPLRLFVTYTSGVLRTLDFTMDVQSAQGIKTDNATVAVIDGTNVLLTPFRHVSIPPPMSSTSVANLSANAAAVALSCWKAADSDPSEDDIAVLLSNGDVNIYRGTRGSTPSFVGRLKHELPPQTHYRQLIWPEPTTIITIASSLDNTRPDSIVVIDFSTTGTSNVLDVQSVAKLSLPSSSAKLARINATLKSGIMVAETIDGTVFRLERVNGEWTIKSLVQLPAFCPWISAFQVADGTVIVVGLSNRNTLYANERVLSQETTSFALHDQHLIVSTLTHTARFVHTDVEMEDQVVMPPDASDAFDEAKRQLERGSKIVTVVSGDTKLVLQMPRGNLETIFPRALVLSAVRSLLDRLDFKRAFILCRKHRIDMNLLVDHAPDVFMENVGKFVRDIEDSDYLNLFLSSLSTPDVSVSIYKSRSTKPKKQVFDHAAGAKVNTVCNAVREALSGLDAMKYVTTLLTTYARMSPPDLEAAMRRIRDLKSVSNEETERALKYLIFLADVDKLFNVALGMYDFQLVVKVAQFSQKDPREYLPFLTELRQLSPHRQRFRIDDHLGRHQSALKHLHSLLTESTESDSTNVFNELLDYVRKHKIYQIGLELFEKDVENRKQLLEVYADYLVSISDMSQAGLIYYMAGNKDAALENYKKDSKWREAFAVAQEIGSSDEQIQQLADELSASLMELSKFKEAAVVLEDYKVDIRGTTRALVKGSFWEEAARLAFKHKSAYLIDEVVKPGVLEGKENLLEELKEIGETFTKQRARLDSVRIKMAEKQAKIDAGEYDPILDSIDMMSDTSSMATSGKYSQSGKSRSIGTSQRSGRTTASLAKSRKKQERHRASGRSGTIYEEEFLVKSLCKTVDKSNTMRVEVHNLILALMKYEMPEEARSLQTSFGALLLQIEKGLGGVFEPYKQQAPAVGSAQPVNVSLYQTGNAAIDTNEDSRITPPQFPASAPPFSDDAFGLAILGSHWK